MTTLEAITAAAGRIHALRPEIQRTIKGSQELLPTCEKCGQKASAGLKEMWLCTSLWDEIKNHDGIEIAHTTRGLITEAFGLEVHVYPCRMHHDFPTSPE